MEPVLVFSLVIVLSCMLSSVFQNTLLSLRSDSGDPAWTSAVYLDYLSLFCPPGLRSWPFDPIYSLGYTYVLPMIYLFSIVWPFAFLWPRLGIKLAYGSVCLSSLSPHNKIMLVVAISEWKHFFASKSYYSWIFQCTYGLTLPFSSILLQTVSCKSYLNFSVFN